MADTKNETSTAPADKVTGSLSADAAYAAAASATNISDKPASQAEKAAANPAPATTETQKPVAPAAKPATATKTAVKKTAASKPATKKAPAKRKVAAKPVAKTTLKKTTKGTKKMATTKTAATKRVAKNTKAANTKAANTAKKTAEKLGSRFETMTADAQARAKAAADRAVALSKNAVEFNRENVETLIESGKIAAKGAQEIGKTNVKYTRENFVEASRALQGLFSVATPKDMFEKQADYVRSGLDRVMDQTSNNADAVVKLAGKAYQPIADRVSEIRKELKKAA
ncbi:MAG: phasin family protein [Sphingomonadales bacterium]|nr:phasin family protein [Sphingomonadales bacterium]NCO48272.1 phasin family protein [Sphingomonadales bacterium]NCP00616.1 phasin family protein [Sphingomonadales bacterium]NCP25380.1 phasin family protein [Sphingomonadales bacterium]NCP41816.1 phasin family protein [Sphingomonadales bacterium]